METLRKDILLMEYTRSMIEEHVEHDKRKDTVPERVEYARTVIQRFESYLNKTPVSARRKEEMRRWKKGVANAREYIAQSQENDYLWSAHKVFARYGCLYVLKNTFNHKDKFIKCRPTLKFLAVVLTILAETKEGVLDGPLVRAIIMNIGTVVYLLKGNAVLGRANRDQGRNYHRVVEAYAEALQKKE